MNLIPSEENILADAWLRSIIEFLPKFSERNHAEIEKQEQLKVIDKLL